MYVNLIEHLRRPLLASPQISNPFLISEESQTASELGMEAIALESCKRSTGTRLHWTCVCVCVCDI